MATEKVSKIYGRPNFGLIVAGFAIAIVILLIAGVIFMRYRPLPKVHHRTGMTILLSPSRLMQLSAASIEQ